MVFKVCLPMRVDSGLFEAMVAAISTAVSINASGAVQASTMPSRYNSAPEALMETAMEIAATIASKSPLSTRMGKHTLNTIEDMSLRDGYRYEQDMTAIIGRTEDAREAQAAFREKRQPVFVGR